MMTRHEWELESGFCDRRYGFLDFGWPPKNGFHTYRGMESRLIRTGAAVATGVERVSTSND
jgi:hypothetical protein